MQANDEAHFVVAWVDAFVEAQETTQVEGTVRLNFQTVDLDTHHGGVGRIAHRHASVESGH
uniref:Uncharacterized protein n=1 Tax=Pseudomonas fluorescens TaxID=294 RepID=A0A5E6XBW2_PSEFL|nr:hypothetical protein PS652_05286 [Pseudomonas fluorescens]